MKFDSVNNQPNCGRGKVNFQGQNEATLQLGMEL